LLAEPVIEPIRAELAEVVAQLAATCEDHGGKKQAFTPIILKNYGVAIQSGKIANEVRVEFSDRDKVEASLKTKQSVGEFLNLIAMQ
jgi:hypothetical protein